MNNEQDRSRSPATRGSQACTDCKAMADASQAMSRNSKVLDLSPLVDGTMQNHDTIAKLVKDAEVMLQEQGCLRVGFLSTSFARDMKRALQAGSLACDVDEQKRSEWSRDGYYKKHGIDPQSGSYISPGFYCSARSKDPGMVQYCRTVFSSFVPGHDPATMRLEALKSKPESSEHDKLQAHYYSDKAVGRGQNGVYAEYPHPQVPWPSDMDEQQYFQPLLSQGSSFRKAIIGGDRCMQELFVPLLRLFSRLLKSRLLSKCSSLGKAPVSISDDLLVDYFTHSSKRGLLDPHRPLWLQTAFVSYNDEREYDLGRILALKIEGEISKSREDGLKSTEVLGQLVPHRDIDLFTVFVHNIPDHFTEQGTGIAHPTGLQTWAPRVGCAQAFNEKPVGEGWVGIDALAGSLIVMPGLLLQCVTRNLLEATWHRVISLPKELRYWGKSPSGPRKRQIFSSFCFPAYDCSPSPMPQLVNFLGDVSPMDVARSGDVATVHDWYHWIACNMGLVDKKMDLVSWVAEK